MFPTSQVVLTTCFLSTSLGAPQLFPFSNLRSYFDHQARNGPGGVKTANPPELTTIVDTPIFRPPSKIGGHSVKNQNFPNSQHPPNHKPDPSPSLEPPLDSSAAEPVAKYYPPVPEQVLKAPDAVPPILYGLEPAQVNVGQKNAFAIPAFVSSIPISVVGDKYNDSFGGFIPSVPSVVHQSPVSVHQPATVFLPTVPSQDLQTPTAPFEFIKQESSKQNETRPSSTKTKISNHSYPKKWRPEKENLKKKCLKSDDGKLNCENNSEPKKKDKYPKQIQQIASETTNNLQNKRLPIFPIQAAATGIVPNQDEQVASETGFIGATAGIGGHGIGGGGGGHGIGGGADRVEFQMHGRETAGPVRGQNNHVAIELFELHNRQFRYEERDTHGHVKGHYGFYNKHGKLQIVSYSADPEHGFKADGNFGKHGII
ncbi:hypothetical protein C0J52_20107 [Blattella germanica]|nr:hypothetical protein C0J52_20107 [Blattella germanica]